MHIFILYALWTAQAPQSSIPYPSHSWKSTLSCLFSIEFPRVLGVLRWEREHNLEVFRRNTPILFCGQQNLWRFGTYSDWTCSVCWTKLLIREFIQPSSIILLPIRAKQMRISIDWYPALCLLLYPIFCPSSIPFFQMNLFICSADHFYSIPFNFPSSESPLPINRQTYSLYLNSALVSHNGFITPHAAIAWVPSGFTLYNYFSQTK